MFDIPADMMFETRFSFSSVYVVIFSQVDHRTRSGGPVDHMTWFGGPVDLVGSYCENKHSIIRDKHGTIHRVRIHVYMLNTE